MTPYNKHRFDGYKTPYSAPIPVLPGVLHPRTVRKKPKNPQFSVRRENRELFLTGHKG
jgi:hypothetical protein